jgi:FtsP/CotA-like multicopper oxidase with cupredoxin domain
MFVKNGMHTPKADDNSTPTGRHFVQGAPAAGMTALAEGRFNQAGAKTIAHSPSVLTGNHLNLAIEAHQVNFTGRRAKATLVNGFLPGLTLKWRAGDTVTVAVTNRLPGKTFVYRFPVLPRGTNWYHSHREFQEQPRLWGALVSEPRDKDPITYDHETRRRQTDSAVSNEILRSTAVVADSHKYTALEFRL